MREIKFRAWWKDAKIMVAVKAIRNNESIEFFVPVTSGDKTWNELEVLDESEQYELMQFTGLKDKNGKEIYEGDVLEFETVMVGKERMVIEYAKGYYPNFALFDSSEVIGNIYKNPELITNA